MVDPEKRLGGEQALMCSKAASLVGAQ